MWNRELAAYREADVQSASPVEVVIMLYDALVRDMKRVIAAIGRGDIEDRVSQSNHAFLVLQELECLLDMENGGSTAKDLSRFYSHVRAKVLEVQLKLDPAIVERQIGMLLELREGWVQAMGAAPEASSAAKMIPLAAQLAANPYGGVEEGQCCGWSA
jgi:flagellar secretion chaperone FliS